MESSVFYYQIDIRDWFFLIRSQQLELPLNPYKGWTDDVRDGEIEFTLGKISIAQDNESSWSYLRAIIEDNLTKYQTGKSDTLTLDGTRSRLISVSFGSFRVPSRVKVLKS